MSVVLRQRYDKFSGFCRGTFCRNEDVITLLGKRKVKQMALVVGK